jgi:hypothetical protein
MEAASLLSDRLPGYSAREYAEAGRRAAVLDGPPAKLTEDAGHHFPGALALLGTPSMQYRRVSVRTSRQPRATAGVAMHISSRLFFPSTLNFDPAWIAYVSPSSLKQKILPPYAPATR